MSGFGSKDPTPEEKRASLSYLFGFTDGLMWAVSHQEELPAMLDEILEAQGEDVIRPLIQSVSFAASELYDELGADPDAWAPTEEIIKLRPDPDWRGPS